jgi:hypothetical protein
MGIRLEQRNVCVVLPNGDVVRCGGMTWWGVMRWRADWLRWRGHVAQNVPFASLESCKKAVVARDLSLFTDIIKHHGPHKPQEER